MAFAKPDMTFTPGSFSGTGLQYLDQYYGIVKSNVQTLKLKGAHAPCLRRCCQHARAAASAHVSAAAMLCRHTRAFGHRRRHLHQLVRQVWPQAHESTCPLSILYGWAGSPLNQEPIVIAWHEYIITYRSCTPCRNGLNNGAISAFVADMGFSGVRACATCSLFV